MTAPRAVNRKLLVSVFNPQEAREAVLGGARIVDSEDPRGALGNIKPHHIMAISDAVLNYSRDLDVQLSTNIGEDQLLFRRSQTGQAIQKSPYEIAGKAAQAAIGVACSMGTRVHPCNIVKVGVDGMPVELVKEALQEVVLTLNRTEEFCHCQVMAVFFVQDLESWNERKKEREVRNTLVELREFHSVDPKEKNPFAFDLCEYAVNTLRDLKTGKILFTRQKEVSLKSLKERRVLPDDATHTRVALNELFPHRKYFPQVSKLDRTTRDVIKTMVDAAADAGVDGIMIDTQIQTKVVRLCAVDTASLGLVDINRFDTHSTNPKLTRKGILSLEDLKFFVDYCHYRGIEANIAGSVQSYHAQQLWVKIPELDQLATRWAASAVKRNPYDGSEETDTREHSYIRRNLVRGLVPPEQGSILNLPISLKKDPRASITISQLRQVLDRERQLQGFPSLKCYFVNKYGEAEEIR